MDRPQNGLGASDAAAILGVSRWHTPLDVWLEKTGQHEETPKAEYQEWGLLLEPALAGRYSQVTGRRLRRVGTIRSKDHPILYAHPDRLVIGEPGLVEIKVSSRRWSEIPIYYKTQAIQQMIVSNREWVDFAVLERGQRFATPIPRQERDRSLEADFIAELEGWWERYVVGGEAPPMDGGDAGRKYLMTKYPDNEGEIVATTQMLPLVDEYRIAVHNRKQVEQVEEVLKQRVMDLIGSGSSLVGPFGKIKWSKYNQKKTDWKEVAALYRRILNELGTKRLPWVQKELGVRGMPWTEALDMLATMYSHDIPSSRLTTDFKEETDG